jgi:hypothetical protein
MSDDIRNDPEYTASKGAMFGSHVKGILWGAGAAIATQVLFTVGLFSPVGLLLAGAAVFSAYKAWSSYTDERAVMSDVTAKRTVQRLGETNQRQPAIAVTAPEAEQQATEETKWQQDIAAQRARATQMQR